MTAALKATVVDAPPVPSLRQLTDTRVPLADSQEARVVSFRPSDGGIEPLAILIGQLPLRQPVLVRLHVAGLAEDLMAALGQGPSVRAAIADLAVSGGGVVLYLRQERPSRSTADIFSAASPRPGAPDTGNRAYRLAADMLILLGLRCISLVGAAPGEAQRLATYGLDVTSHFACGSNGPAKSR